ncbi:hypothetical protein CS369_11355 [Candidatus Symbiopectobacterium sp. 'North America']|nr:hypothetical protein [Candidatus Symbiopectobacterium sp. 'North America']
MAWLSGANDNIFPAAVTVAFESESVAELPGALRRSTSVVVVEVVFPDRACFAAARRKVLEWMPVSAL